MARKVPDKWIRNHSDRQAILEGFWFDPVPGTIVCEFIETFCQPSQGHLATSKAKLLDWERDFIMRLFGWKEPRTGLRRFRTAHLEIAKGNGKTWLMSALSLFMLIIDDEPGNEVVCAACDRDQASLVFEEVKKMAKTSKDLIRKVNIIDYRKMVLAKGGSNRFRALSSDANANDGGNWNFRIVDELHRFTNVDMWNVLVQSGSKRLQPLLLSITTAGRDETGPWFSQRRLSESINDGTIINIRHLGVVYRALPEDDIDSPDTWRKANPSMGTLISEREFKDSLQQARQKGASELAYFKRVRLNIIQSDVNDFIPIQDWKRQGVDLKIEDYFGEECWIGVDLSSKLDTTSVSCVFRSKETEKEFVSFTWFWLPKDRLEERCHADEAPYDVWSKTDELTLTDGGSVDYHSIRKLICRLADKCNVSRLFSDPYNAQETLYELRNEGVNVFELQQSYRNMSPPTKELQSLVVSRKLRHSNGPMMAWQVGNVRLQTNHIEQIKMIKSRSKGRIDGPVSLAMAVGAMIWIDPKPKKTSVYETRGALRL